MTDVMQIFIVIEIQLFKVKLKLSLIVLTKQGSGEILTQIMPFINTHSNEMHHIIKLTS